jgi:hypothetical protein
MEDLCLVAELFKTSSTLARAAASLEKMISGQEEIQPSEKDALLWSGEFLRAVDWNAQEQAQKPISGGLALQATSVRPTFYSCLFRMAPQLREAGMHDEKNLNLFLNNLYRNLLSPEGPGRGHKKLTPDQCKLGALLLHEIAESILVQINNNGLPQPTATLKDEWKPTANEITPTLTI